MSWKILLAACGMLLFALAAYNYVSCYRCAPVHLTISGGNVCPLRSEMAQKICGEVRNEGIVLEAVNDSNSEKICDDVDAHRIDLGLVLGGFPPDAHPNVRQVATLGVEPLHLMVRGELVKSATPTLDVLRGRRVSLGDRGSNGALLARDLLRLAGMQPANSERAGDFTAMFAAENEMLSLLETCKHSAPPVRAALIDRLPDGIFVVDGMPATLVDELVKTAGYKIVSLPFATAMHLDNRRDHGDRHQRLETSRVESTVVPAFTYGIQPAVPADDCATLGLRLLLVTHKDTPKAAIVRLLRALDKGLAQRYHVDLDAVNVNSEFPPHPGADAFAKDRMPLSVSQMLEPLTNFFSVIGAGAAGGLALWGFLRGLRAVHPDVHLRQIDRIERLLSGSELDETAPTVPLDFINFLEARLAQIKQAAIEDYANGRFRGDEVLVSILTLIADTRHLLVQRRKQVCIESATPARPGRPGRLIDAA